MSNWTALGIALLLLAANGYFVAAEFALISSRRTTIEARVAAGSRAARTTLSAMENVSLMLAGAQLGITVASIGLGAIGEPALAHLLEPLFATLQLPQGFVEPVSFTLALAIVVFLHVVLGEMVPKNIALIGPERTALILTPPLFALVRLAKPILLSFNSVANLTLDAMRVRPRDEVSSTFNRAEVSGLVEQSHREGLLDEKGHELLVSALSLDENSVRRIMLPLADVIAVPFDATAEQFEDVACRTGFSRLPMRATEGHLVGYVHLKDILDVTPERYMRPLDPAIFRALPVIDEAAGLRAAASSMQLNGSHLALVTDYAGETLGIVALEDVLEELVGEIRDGSHREFL